MSNPPGSTDDRRAYLRENDRHPVSNDELLAFTRAGERRSHACEVAAEYLAAFDAGRPMPDTNATSDIAWASALASCVRMLLADVAR